MMYIIKIFFTIVLSFIVAFGLWYLIFLFLTGEFNPIHWHWLTKILYLMIGFSSLNGILNEMTKNGL